MLSRLGILAIVGAALPAAAWAEAAKYWTVTVGIEARVAPRWQGADDKYETFPVPLLDVRRAGTMERFRGPRDGISIGLIDTGSFRLGPVGKIRFPRKVKDDSNLVGLGDVGWAYEVGVFADYYFVPWLRTRAEVRQGWGGHDGLTADLMADVIAQVTPQLMLSAGPRISFANTDATVPYYSVTPAQSVASGLPVFNARGGVRGVGAGAQARYFWTPLWATHAFVEYERLAGDAKNSPIVALRGSPDQWTFGAGITYAFDMKAWW
ncbi:MAG TPA: MipA/OmpV family protein [Xanthobacteraceae bacterium]|nr:MipA/OmpV family protein [Xanthobacteraceae bacterium]